jgi:hypothetical protein
MTLQSFITQTLGVLSQPFRVFCIAAIVMNFNAEKATTERIFVI